MSDSLFSENLHISAMVQIGKLNTQVDLSALATALEVNDNILYIEHGKLINKGVNNKKFSKKKSDSRKYFYNQVTIHIFNSKKANKRVNVKVFNNGTIQMTGVNSHEIGEYTAKTVITEFNKLPLDIKIFDHENVQQIGELETVLINSDFDIRSEINREKLHRHIILNGYMSSFEPCTYPGVNIKFYHNPIRQNYGICDCETPCDGKGKNNTCKKITVAVFKSGKIIITGGRSKNNIQTAYEFITEFIEENREEVLVKDGVKEAAATIIQKSWLSRLTMIME
jgi:TATA-box binding protein (TBP) (component of TFIID and TFIIIB)|tara:strand:+ start:2208 stop:3053 length:846 start_codon:yes stop_codon:yes gene_type:complete